MEAAVQSITQTSAASRFVQMYGSAPHSELISLGWKEPSCAG
jgi:hypothetical protein